MKTNNTFQVLALAGLMLTATAPVQAADSLTTRIATGLGSVIAVQGNAAFQQIREDLQDELTRSFENWLPESAPQGADAEAGTDAGESAGNVQ